jgi:hypothetical protein
LAPADESRRPLAAAPAGASPMQDILWIGLFLTLLAASLGYVALCQRA